MKYIAAIDLGSSKATVAVGNRTGTGLLHIVGIATAPMKEGVMAGEITNVEEITRAVRGAIDQLEQKYGIDITEAYASISGQELSCIDQSYFVPVGGDGNVIRTDDVTKLHDLMNSMPAPNNNICIFDRIPQTYLIDEREQTRHPVGRFGKRLDTTYKFVYGSNDNVERLKQAFKSLGIRLAGIFTSPQASAVAVLSAEERDLGVAVVDIGAMCSDVCIWQENTTRYVGSIPLGSEAINRDMRSAAIPVSWIEKLKIKYGYASPELVDEDLKGKDVKVPGSTPKYDKQVSLDALAQIIEARLTDIVEAVTGELRESGYASRLGSGIVLTGGGAQMKRIDDLFRGRLKIEVRVGAVENSLLDEASAQYALRPEYSTVIGLLLLGEAPVEMGGEDGLTEQHRREEEQRQAKAVAEAERREREEEELRDRNRKKGRKKRFEEPGGDDESDPNEDEDGGEERKSRRGSWIKRAFFKSDNDGDDLAE